MRNKISYIMAISLLLLSCSSCASAHDQDVASTAGGFVHEDDSSNQSTSDKGASPSSDGDNNAIQDAPVSDSDITYEDPAYTVEENLVQMDEVVEMDGFTYQIIDFEVTKEFGDRNRETFVDYLDDVTDADNNLTGDQSYVFVTLSIQNNTDKEVEAMRAPGVVVGIDSDWEVIPLSAIPFILKNYGQAARKRWGISISSSRARA